MLCQHQSWPREIAARGSQRPDGMLAIVQVIVLEKGGFTPAAELALTEQEGFSTTCEMGSLLTTLDAGACLCLHAFCPGMAALSSRPAFSIPGPEVTETELRSWISCACCLSMLSLSLSPSLERVKAFGAAGLMTQVFSCSLLSGPGMQPGRCIQMHRPCPYAQAEVLAAGMSILAGSTLGGGTRVNWQAPFRTPDHVRREWAEQHGLGALTSQRYTAALDAVCARLGVTTGEGPVKAAARRNLLQCPCTPMRAPSAKRSTS